MREVELDLVQFHAQSSNLMRGSRSEIVLKTPRAVYMDRFRRNSILTTPAARYRTPTFVSMRWSSQIFECRASLSIVSVIRKWTRRDRQKNFDSRRCRLGLSNGWQRKPQAVCSAWHRSRRARSGFRGGPRKSLGIEGRARRRHNQRIGTRVTPPNYVSSGEPNFIS
jgi:hypothetical protein